MGQQVEAVQPSNELIEKLEHKPSVEDPGVRASTDFTHDELPYQLTDVLISDNLPYYPYYALKEGANHVVHPMALGRFLLRNAEASDRLVQTRSIML